MRPNHKKYTFEIEIPIKEAFNHCCEVYGVSQVDMINDVLLRFVQQTEEQLKESIKEIENEKKKPKLFSF